MGINETNLTRHNSSVLASVVQHKGFVSVALPSDLAVPTVKRFLSYYSLEGFAFEGSRAELQECLPLRHGEWCVVIKGSHHKQLSSLFPASHLASAPLVEVERAPSLCLQFPVNTLCVLPAHVKKVKHALERVRELYQQDESGAPLAWVEAVASSETLHGHDKHTERERNCIEGADAIASLPPEPEGDSPLLPKEEILREFERIRVALELPTFPLAVYRGTVNKNGYVTGRVFSNASGPIRMAVTLCPNADLAEAVATLVHEFAHLTSKTTGHGSHFKEAIVTLASELYGARFFDAPRQRLTESYHILDMWVATGIRAAFKDAEPPAAKEFDEQLTASVVSRIQKMRALAADQPGTAEAVTATAIANTQVTLYELGGYRIRLDAEIDEQMLDRWLNIGKGSRWKRDLAFTVAEFCNVFALARPDKGWMHFFGKHRDIIAAEYLYSVCLGHIERRCARHIQAWKARKRTRVTGGQTRSEKISFCTSAVAGVGDKMEAIRAHERQCALEHPEEAEAQAFRLTSHDLQNAESFAWVEHDKRGMGWGSDSSRSYRYNESGYEAGKSLQLNSGVGASKVRGLLGSK